MKSENLVGAWVFFSWTLFLIIVVTVVGYNGLYGQDSYEYLRYCGRLFDFIDKGIPPGDYYWPVNYPLMGAILAFITGPQIALQLLSILAASWIMYLMCMFLFREFPGREREVIIYVVLFLGLSPYFFRYSISSMSDVPALAFLCTAYYGLYRGYKQNHTVWLYAAWFFSAMAIFTRIAFLPLMAPAVLFCGYCMYNKFKPLLFASAVLTSLIPLTFHLYFKQQNFDSILHHYQVTEWSFVNLFRTHFTTIDGNWQYAFPNIIFVLSFLLHPGFMFPGILFLFISLKKKTKRSLLYPVAAAAVFSYLLFIAGIPFRNVRFVVPVMPFYLVLCFPGFLAVLAWCYEKKNLQAVLLFSALALQLMLVILAFRPFLTYNRLERRIAEKIIELHPPVLYTFGIDGALRSYGYRGTIINMWDEPLDSINQGAFLLFNKQNNEEQWRGMNPMINYNLIVDQAKALKIDEFESGWEIYKIEEAYPHPHSRFPSE